MDNSKHAPFGRQARIVASARTGTLAGRPLLGAFALAALLFASAPTVAQQLPELPATPAGDAAPASDPTSLEAIAARRTKIALELERTDGTLRDAEPTDIRHALEVQRRLRTMDQLLSAQTALSARDPVADQPSRPTSEVPSALTLNALYEAQYAQKQAEDLAAKASDSLAAAKEKLANAERERRRARTELEDADSGTKADFVRSLELRELESRAAQEEVYLRRAELLAWQVARDQDADAEIEARIERTREALARGEGNSTSVDAAVNERRDRFVQRRDANRRRLATVELALQSAQSRYLQQPEPSLESLQEVEALTAHRDLLRREIETTEARLAALKEHRSLWSIWETLLRGEVGSPDELAAWEAKAIEQAATLRQIELQTLGRIAELDRTVDGLERQLSRAPEPSLLRRALSELLETVSRLRAEVTHQAALASADRRVAERVRADLGERSGHIDWQEYAARAQTAAQDIWRYELTTVDDASITVGSLVLALLFLFAGLWAARRGSNLVAQQTKRRFKLDPGAGQALQTITFYALLVSFTLLALRAVHFPLTAFTVLGGALAIGVGFGSQNVMNNFISGLILMLERPVRAHDVVEIDGNHGTIEKIGARSTQIRSDDGRHIIVPNSFFLQSNVVNWTLSDDLVRAKVSVGVVYGSPTRLVEKLIQQVIHDNDQILKIPKPIFVFEEFGDNALNFDVYFWVRARSPMERRIVQSEVRFRIDDLFREHDLIIAFPQRDVHIDSVAPLEVRVIGENRSAASPAEPDNP